MSGVASAAATSPMPVMTLVGELRTGIPSTRRMRSFTQPVENPLSKEEDSMPLLRGAQRACAACPRDRRFRQAEHQPDLAFAVHRVGIKLHDIRHMQLRLRVL